MVSTSITARGFIVFWGPYVAIGWLVPFSCASNHHVPAQSSGFNTVKRMTVLFALMT